MPVDPKLQELIDRWEDLQDQGHEVSAQELCSEHPELLEELKRRIKALKAMSWLLESDPPSDGGSEANGAVASLPPTLGRYRLDELVGAGGFGQVWKGYLRQQRYRSAERQPTEHQPHPRNRLPNGTRVRVPACDHGVIEAVIAAASAAPARGEAKVPRC